MKKQYLAMIVRGNGLKENAFKRMNSICNNTQVRYANSLEEAQKSIEFCKNEYTLEDVGKKSTVSCGSFGIVTELDEKTYEHLKVVDSYIKVREVTEWEEL